MKSKTSLIRYFIYIVLLLFIFFAVNNTSTFAQNGSNMSTLRQWVGKDPFIPINGKKLFDNHIFQTAFKKTVGSEIYQTFMDYYKGGRYFGAIGKINATNGVMAIRIQELAYPFDTTIFVDTTKGFIDVCWKDGNIVDSKTMPVNTFISHDGGIIKLKNPECSDVSYEDFLAASKSPTSSSKNQGSIKPVSTIVLTPKSRTYTTTGHFSSAGAGRQNYTIVKIDTKAFSHGGKLTITVDIGQGESQASIDLFPEGVTIPNQGRPIGSLVGFYDVPPGKKNILDVNFLKGQIFQLGVTGGWRSRSGASNDFTLKAHVE